MIGKTELVVAFFVAAVLAGLFLRYGSSQLPSGDREHFMQQEVGMPLNGGGIGPYDQVSIAGAAGWMSTEPTYSGGAAPVAQPDDSNKLMYLVGNKTDTDCCPSSFNTDTGCVCLTNSQKDFMASRGGNKVNA
jgi:hypothetical protein